VVGLHGDTNELQTYVWTGSSWQNDVQSNDIEDYYNDVRPFDIAYEQSSGDAILVYGPSGGGLKYRTNMNAEAYIWDGSSWGNHTTLSTDLSYNRSEPIALAYDNNGNLMVVAGEATNNVVRWNQWNGSSWGTGETVDPNPSGSNVIRWFRSEHREMGRELLDRGNDKRRHY